MSAVIRLATEGDRDALYDICVRTGDAGADARRLLAHHQLYGHLWAGQYLIHAPEYAFVADWGSDVVGYVVGALDTESFEAELRRDWWPPLQLEFPLPGTGTAKDRELIGRLHEPDHTDPRVTRKYPSHLHINLLPHTQGQGLGRVLMRTLFDTLVEAGSIGVHLGVSPHNTRALGFYEHLGLRRHDSAGGVLFTARLGATA